MERVIAFSMECDIAFSIERVLVRNALQLHRNFGVPLAFPQRSICVPVTRSLLGYFCPVLYFTCSEKWTLQLQHTIFQKLNTSKEQCTYHQLLALEEFCHVQASELKKRYVDLHYITCRNHPIQKHAVQDSVSIDIEQLYISNWKMDLYMYICSLTMDL